MPPFGNGGYTSSRPQSAQYKRPVSRIRFTQRVDALGRLAELLGKLPCFSVHNGLVGYLQRSANPPWDSLRRFYLYRTACGSENSPYAPYTPAWRGSVPRHSRSSYRDWKIPLCFSRYPLPCLPKYTAGVSNLILKENTGNIVGSLCPRWSIGKMRRTTAAASSSISQWYLFFRVFLVTVNGTVGRSGLAGFSLDTDGGFLLAAQVTQIPLVHDVEEGGKFIAVLIVAVHCCWRWQQSGHPCCRKNTSV